MQMVSIVKSSLSVTHLTSQCCAVAHVTKKKFAYANTHTVYIQYMYTVRIMLLCLSLFIGSGKLEFNEFCALVYTLANTVDKETLEKELREAFRLFDKEVTQKRCVTFPVTLQHWFVVYLRKQETRFQFPLGYNLTLPCEGGNQDLIKDQCPSFKPSQNFISETPDVRNWWLIWWNVSVLVYYESVQAVH